MQIVKFAMRVLHIGCVLLLLLSVAAASQIPPSREQWTGSKYFPQENNKVFGGFSRRSPDAAPPEIIKNPPEVLRDEPDPAEPRKTWQRVERPKYYETLPQPDLVPEQKFPTKENARILDEGSTVLQAPEVLVKDDNIVAGSLNRLLISGPQDQNQTPSDTPGVWLAKLPRNDEPLYKKVVRPGKKESDEVAPYVFEFVFNNENVQPEKVTSPDSFIKQAHKDMLHIEQRQSGPIAQAQPPLTHVAMPTSEQASESKTTQEPVFTEQPIQSTPEPASTIEPATATTDPAAATTENANGEKKAKSTTGKKESKKTQKEEDESDSIPEELMWLSPTPSLLPLDYAMPSFQQSPDPSPAFLVPGSQIVPELALLQSPVDMQTPDVFFMDPNIQDEVQPVSKRSSREAKLSEISGDLYGIPLMPYSIEEPFKVPDQMVWPDSYIYEANEPKRNRPKMSKRSIRSKRSAPKKKRGVSVKTTTTTTVAPQGSTSTPPPVGIVSDATDVPEFSWDKLHDWVTESQEKLDREAMDPAKRAELGRRLADVFKNYGPMFQKALESL